MSVFRFFLKLFVIVMLTAGPILPGTAAAPAAGGVQTIPSPAALENSNVNFVSSQIGGDVGGMAILDHKAYISIGTSLAIFDISSPATPYILGAYQPFPQIISHVVVEHLAEDADQTRAYVTDYDALWIIDVTDPSNTALLGKFDPPDGCHAFTVVGQKAFAACGQTLYALDISDPAHIIQLDALVVTTPDDGNAIRQVVVFGDYAYIPTSYQGLVIINISDPSDLQAAGVIRETGFESWNDIIFLQEASRVLAYIVSPYQGVVVAEFTGPTHMQVLGKLYSSYWPNDLALANGLAYVSTQDGLWIVDVSNPDNVREAGRYHSNSMTSKIALDGSTVLLSIISGGIDFLDVSQPALPHKIASHYEPVYVLDVFARNNHAYTIGADGLHIFDISDPYRPTAIGAYDSGFTNHIELVQDNAYLSGEAGKFRIVDVSDPYNPQVVGAYTDTVPVAANPGCDWQQTEVPTIPDFALQGSYAYLAYASGGIRVLNLANPANIQPVTTYRGPGWGYVVGIRMMGSKAVVLDGGCVAGPVQAGLYVVDLANPTSPTALGAISLPYLADAIEVVGSIAYVTTGLENSTNTGLHVIDLSDPAHPYQIGFLELTHAIGLYIDGSLAYISDSVGLRVIDISNPATPLITGTYNLKNARGVHHTGCVTYVTQWGYGMTLLGYQGEGENCSISGYVRDEDGQPMPGVEVEANNGQSDVTDANGAYSLAGLPANTYVVTPNLASGPYYPTNYQLKVARDFTLRNFTLGEPPSAWIYLPHIRR